MVAVFFLILIVAIMASVTSHRNAIVAIFAIGFLQDPFRKLVLGEPIYFIVTVGLVFGAVFLATLQRQGVNGLREPFVGWSSQVNRPIIFFLMILGIQFIHSSLRYGNPIVSAIGLLSYTAPFFAIVVGYFLVTQARNIRSFMKLYISIGVVLTVTVMMSFVGFDYQIFKEVGSGLLIYDQGTVLRSFSGFMRTGEIAAWHIATACCFIIILFFSSKRRPPILIVCLLVLFMMAAIALTGRRKMLMLVTLFTVIYGLGFSFYRRKLSVNYLISASLLVLAIWAAAQFFASGGDSVSNYIARGTSVYGSATTRAFELGFKPLGWAINRVGLFGGGLGIASQGSQFFNVSNVAGGSGEGGLGKIMVELGLPGLIAAFWLSLAFAKYINAAIRLSAQHFVPLHILPLMLGIACFLLVNVMTFAVATQVYGDFFILIIIGLLAGFLFALPKLVVRAMNDESIGRGFASGFTTRETSITRVGYENQPNQLI